MAKKNPAASGRHRAVRERLSELTVAVPLAVALVVLVIVGVWATPKVFHTSKKTSSDPALATTMPTVNPSAIANATGTAKPSPSSTASAESDSCTYEVLAGMDARLHKAKTTVAFANDSSIGLLVSGLETQFAAMLKTEDGHQAVADTIGLARQLCATAGNPMLSIDGVRALMSVATPTDIKLLSRIRAVGLIGPEPTLPGASASPSTTN